MSGPEEPDLVELAALADGSIDPARRAQLEARIAASPDLAAQLLEQQQAVALTRTAAIEVEAPATLRARVDDLRRPRHVRRRRVFLAVGGVAAALAIAAGVIATESATTSPEFHATLSAAALGGPGISLNAGTAELTRTDAGWCS